MKAESQNLSLETVYNYTIEMIFERRPFEDVEPYFSPDLWVFGTAEHERISGIQELRKLVEKQNAELKEITVNLQRPNTIKKQHLANGKVVVLSEEMRVDIPAVNNSFIFRLTSTWENIDQKWILVNIHSSTPDSNIDKSESFPVEGIIKKNKELELKIEERTEELRVSLENLKSTQTQLIQSEKMASLGELTAGIAHEIQNPLNFVNNFSEVSSELVEELQEELNMNNPDVAREISNDIKKNLDKIYHHGKRADGIVKSMLQHSRTSSGEKEPTDINSLCDEYLRLAYHGMRAKDKNFNAEFSTDLDPDLPKINVVPQDIGRVLLNLINNAFQAVAEVENGKVTLITQQLNNSITICVADNGPGIPEQVQDKIFQPFFTTKPTGQGTGLGLSLSYDIVKAHGGEIKVETIPEQGTNFKITIPMGTIGKNQPS